MTATNNLTLITNAEAADTVNWDDIGGGQGGGQNLDVFIQGLEAYSRKIDNTTLGFSYDTTTGQDLSASGTHVGLWICVLQPGQLGTDGVEILLGDSSTPKSGNWSGFVAFLSTTWDATKKFYRVWLDPTRVRDYGSGTLPTTLRQFGAEFEMGNISGNAHNCIMDSINYGTNGLTLTGGTSGTPVTFDDLFTKDATDSAGIINVNEQNGRIKIGGATTYFRAEGFAIKAGQQPVCAADWITQEIDISVASAEIFYDSGFLSGVGFEITGTDGNWDVGTLTIADAPSITLNSAVTWNGTSLVVSDTLTINGAITSNVLVSKSIATIAVLTNDLDELDTFTFVSDGTGHAVEMTLSSSDTQGWNCTDSGYTAASSGNETLKVNISSPAVLTINVATGATTPSVYVVGTGTVTVVSGQVTLEVTCQDQITKSAIEGAAITVKAAGSGTYPYNASVTITRSGNVATVSHSGHNLSTDHKVEIKGADQNEYNRIKTLTKIDANSYSFPVSGTPTTPATGTITATAVFIDGKTNASGVISDIRSHGVDQNVSGYAAKGTGSPLYVRAPLSGSIDSATGLSITSLMVSDE